MQWRSYERCPSCGGDKRWLDKTVHDAHTLSYDVCLDCNLAFMNPVPTQEWYDDFYRNEFWEYKGEGKDARYYESKLVKQANWATKFCEWLARDLPDVKRFDRILEVGCAFGMIVRSLAEAYGAEAWGVEPSLYARELAVSCGCVRMAGESIDQALAAPGTKGSFDLIINSHVLENMVNPDRSLNIYRELLKDGGYFLVETPNLFMERSMGIYHPYIFCERSLKHCLAKAGFEIVSLRISGRGKRVIKPRYVTILARKGEKPQTEPPRPNGGLPFGLRMAVARAMLPVLQHKAVRRLDDRLEGHLHKMGRPQAELLRHYLENG